MFRLNVLYTTHSIPPPLCRSLFSLDMVDWNSPQELLKESKIFERFMHSILGLYMWEWFTSLGFDWEFVSGQRKAKWPMTFYFLNRYSLLLALIGIATALNVTSEINCQALYTFNQVAGNFAIGTASINLALRTMAIWSRKWYIVIPLTAVILGHWSLLLQGMSLESNCFDKTNHIEGIQLSAVYDTQLQQCAITQTNNKLLAATFIYTMLFDFLTLILTGVKLLSGEGRSRLVGLIFNDGLIYFVIAFLANLVATIFMLLDLNPIMSVIANVPAATASTIVACRAVRRLSNFASHTVEVFPSTAQGTAFAFRQRIATKVTASQVADGVHVQMETFESPNTGYDAVGNVKTDAYDPEAQKTSDEFKRPPY
ncbi:hypothetical protein APHAL10511_006742 [Amanita phalloides]|nr:hypothetical protein APHAL10511_006742 [Amanita phalloides]